MMTPEEADAVLSGKMPKIPDAPKKITAQEFVDQMLAKLPAENHKGPVDVSSPLKTLEAMGVNPTKLRMALGYELLELAGDLPALAKTEMLAQITRLFQKVFDAADKESLAREGILNEAPPVVNLTFRGYDQALSEAGRRQQREADAPGRLIDIEIPDSPPLPELPGVDFTTTSG